MINRKVSGGFTIVELLIVIVVIAILAALTIVAFNGVRGRANDTAIKNDLKTIAKQFELYKVENNVYPVGTAQLTPLGLKATKSAYGPGFSAVNNLLYCRDSTNGPNKFALLAESKSGKIIVYRSETGNLTELSSWPSFTTSTGNCNDASVNVPIVDSASGRDLLYNGGTWMTYVGG